MISLISKSQKSLSDYIGVLSSLLCLAHCLITPAVISFQMLYHSNSSTFEFLEYIFLFLSFVAVFFSSKNYNRNKGKLVLWLTFMIFASSIIFHDTIPSLVSYLSSASLIMLHLLNIWGKKLYSIIYNIF